MSGVDGFLIVVCVIVPVLILAFSTFVLIYYQHPDDAWTSYFPKGIIISGLSLSILSIFLFLLDIYNQSGDIFCDIESSETINSLCGNIDLRLLWEAMYLLYGLYIFILIPFTMFFYENDNINLAKLLNAYKVKQNSGGTAAADTKIERNGLCSKCFQAFVSQFFVLIMICVILIVCFISLNELTLEVETYEITTSSFLEDATAVAAVEMSTTDDIEVKVSFTLFLICFLSFIGYLFFSILVSIGLISLPVDLFNRFRYRPVSINKQKYLQLKQHTYQKIKFLLDISGDIKPSQGRNMPSVSTLFSKLKRSTKTKENYTLNKNMTFKEFKKQVLSIENDLNDLELCYSNWKHYNPLIPYFKLALSVISFYCSLLWLLHIILHNLTQVHPFLNPLLIYSLKEINFALLGIFLFSLLSIYLLVCVLNGTENLSSYLIIEIHPLKWNETYMSSLLFNLSLLLLSNMGLIYFLSTSFEELIINTETYFLFEIVIKNIKVFTVFFAYNVFNYVIISCAGLILLLKILCRNRTSKEKKDLEKRIQTLQIKSQAEMKQLNETSQDKKASASHVNEVQKT